MLSFACQGEPGVPGQKVSSWLTSKLESAKVHKYRFRSYQSAAETLRSRSDVNTVEIHICTRMTSFSTCTFLCPAPGKLSNRTSSKPYLHNCLWNRSTDVWSFQWNKFTQSLINKEIIPIEYSNPLKSTADKWHRVCRHTNTVVQSEILFKMPVLLSTGRSRWSGPLWTWRPKGTVALLTFWVLITVQVLTIGCLWRFSFLGWKCSFKWRELCILGLRWGRVEK